MTKTNVWHSRSVHVLLPRVEEIRALIGSGSLKEARKIVKDLYPFGQRKYWPYKEWCLVVKALLPGLYPSKKAQTPGWVR